MPETGNIFISAEKLNDLMQQRDDVCVIDTRFNLMQPQLGRKSYVNGHIPGAVYMPLENDFSDPAREPGGRHPLREHDAFVKRLSQLGISPDKMIVIYDDHSPEFAARLWWMLHRLYGFPFVFLLDGGYKAWKKAGYKVTDHIPVPVPAKNLDIKRNPDVYYDGVALNEKIKANANIAVIDARAPERFKGQEEYFDPVPGRIEGAVNLYWADLYGLDGKVREEDVRNCMTDFAHYDEIVVYCGSGVTACAAIAALEQSGMGADVKLYPGGWSDWLHYPDYPKVTY